MVKNFLKSDNISIKKQVAQLWYSHILSNDKVLKNKEVGMYMLLWKCLQNILLKEKSRVKCNLYGMIPFT